MVRYYILRERSSARKRGAGEVGLKGEKEKLLACKVVTKLIRVTTAFAKEPKEACPESQHPGVTAMSVREIFALIFPATSIVFSTNLWGITGI